MWSRLDLKMRGKAAFGRNYWSSVGVAFVMFLFGDALFSKGVSNRFDSQDESFLHSMSSSESMAMALFALIATAVVGIVSLIFVIVKIFVGNLLLVGGSRYFILNQTEHASAGALGYGFQSGQYVNIVVIMFLRTLFIRLWTLLFVVPGIIKHYEYLMIPYILAENPGMNRQEAFLISKRMMMGQKWNAFMLDLSFIGWRILEGITFGIVGVFYVEPYYQATLSELYAYNRSVAYQQGYIR